MDLMAPIITSLTVIMVSIFGIYFTSLKLFEEKKKEKLFDAINNFRKNRTILLTKFNILQYDKTASYEENDKLLKNSLQELIVIGTEIINDVVFINKIYKNFKKNSLNIFFQKLLNFPLFYKNIKLINEEVKKEFIDNILNYKRFYDVSFMIDYKLSKEHIEENKEKLKKYYEDIKKIISNFDINIEYIDNLFFYEKQKLNFVKFIEYKKLKVINENDFIEEEIFENYPNIFYEISRQISEFEKTLFDRNVVSLEEENNIIYRLNSVTKEYLNNNKDNYDLKTIDFENIFKKYIIIDLKKLENIEKTENYYKDFWKSFSVHLNNSLFDSYIDIYKTINYTHFSKNFLIDLNKEDYNSEIINIIKHIFEQIIKIYELKNEIFNKTYINKEEFVNSVFKLYLNLYFLREIINKFYEKRF